MYGVFSWVCCSAVSNLPTMATTAWQQFLFPLPQPCPHFVFHILHGGLGCGNIAAKDSPHPVPTHAACKLLITATVRLKQMMKAQTQM